jgi:hypothetical protein
MSSCQRKGFLDVRVRNFSRRCEDKDEKLSGCKGILNFIGGNFSIENTGRIGRKILCVHTGVGI